MGASVEPWDFVLCNYQAILVGVGENGLNCTSIEAAKGFA